MRDGDRIAEPGYSDAPRVHLPPEVQRAYWTLSGLVFRYVILCGAFAAIGRAGVYAPDPFWQTMLTTFGNVTFWGLVFAAVYEGYRDERAWRAAHPAPKPPHPAPMQVIYKEQRGEVTHTEVREYPNPPSEAFIKWLFEHIGDGGRIPGERAIEDEWHEQADVWLDVLTREKLIEKTGTHPNAPRRIVAGVTKETAMQRFGYGDRE